jgi:hypothetical protein
MHVVQCPHASVNMCTGLRSCVIRVLAGLLLFVFVDNVACRVLTAKQVATPALRIADSNAGWARLQHSSRVQVHSYITTTPSGRPCGDRSRTHGWPALLRGKPNGSGQGALQGHPRQLTDRKPRNRRRTSTSQQQQQQQQPQDSTPQPQKGEQQPKPAGDFSSKLANSRPATSAVGDAYKSASSSSSLKSAASLMAPIRSSCGDGGASLCSERKERLFAKAGLQKPP